MPSERAVLDKHRRGEAITPADTVATITTEAELEMYRIGLDQRGALDARAKNAIETRRHTIRQAKKGASHG